MSVNIEPARGNQASEALAVFDTSCFQMKKDELNAWVSQFLKDLGHENLATKKHRNRDVEILAPGQPGSKQIDKACTYADLSKVGLDSPEDELEKLRSFELAASEQESHNARIERRSEGLQDRFQHFKRVAVGIYTYEKTRYLDKYQVRKFADQIKNDMGPQSLVNWYYFAIKYHPKVHEVNIDLASPKDLELHELPLERKLCTTESHMAKYLAASAEDRKAFQAPQVDFNHGAFLLQKAALQSFRDLVQTANSAKQAQEQDGQSIFEARFDFSQLEAEFNAAKLLRMVANDEQNSKQCRSELVQIGTELSLVLNQALAVELDDQQDEILARCRAHLAGITGDVRLLLQLALQMVRRSTVEMSPTGKLKMVAVFKQYTYLNQFEDVKDYSPGAKNTSDAAISLRDELDLLERFQEEVMLENKMREALDMPAFACGTLFQTLGNGAKEKLESLSRTTFLETVCSLIQARIQFFQVEASKNTGANVMIAFLPFMVSGLNNTIDLTVDIALAVLDQHDKRSKEDADKKITSAYAYSLRVLNALFLANLKAAAHNRMDLKTEAIRKVVSIWGDAQVAYMAAFVDQGDIRKSMAEDFGLEQVMIESQTEDMPRPLENMKPGLQYIYELVHSGFLYKDPSRVFEKISVLLQGFVKDGVVIEETEGAQLHLLVLAIFSRKDLLANEEVASLVQSIVLRGTSKLNSVIESDLVCLLLITKLKQLVKRDAEAEQDLLPSASPEALVMYSDLFSGGVETHLLSVLNFFRLSDALQHLKQTKCPEIKTFFETAIDALKNKEDVYSETDKLLLEVQGQSETGEPLLVLFAALQAFMKKKPSMSFCRIGGALGAKVTRVAFALMIKAAGLTSELETLIAQLDYGLLSLPEEAGPERDTQALKLCQEDQGFEKIAHYWAVASRMRIWINGKKQSLEAKIQKENVEGVYQKAEQNLSEIVDQIAKKGALLVCLAQPSSFHSTEVESDQNGGLNLLKKPSFAPELADDAAVEEEWRSKVTSWRSDLQDLGFLSHQNETVRKIQSASTTSILACLQAPITEFVLSRQIGLVTSRAVKKFASLHLIKSILISSPRQTLLIGDAFTELQGTSKNETRRVAHYTDGVKGCGRFLESQIQEIFFQVLAMFTSAFSSGVKDGAMAPLYETLRWKFTARDFPFLLDQLPIFKVLAPEKDLGLQLLMECAKPVAKQRTQLFRELFVGLVARSTESETVKTMQLGGAAPAISRAKSVLDQSACGQLLAQGYNEIFRFFDRVVQLDSKAIKYGSLVSNEEESIPNMLSVIGNAEGEPQGQSGRESRDRLFKIINGSNFKKQLSDLLGLTQLHVHVSLASPQSQTMLQSLATPYHIATLLHLLVAVRPGDQMRLLKIVEGLVQNALPSDLFEVAANKLISERQLEEQVAPYLNEIRSVSPLSFLLLRLAAQLRDPLCTSGKPLAFKLEDEPYSTASRQMVRLATRLSPLDTVKALCEGIIQALPKPTQADKEILFDLLDAQLTPYLGVGDQVVFTRGYAESRGAQVHESSQTEQIYEVTESHTLNQSMQTVKVYSSKSQQHQTMSASDLKVAPIIQGDFELSPDCLSKLVQVLASREGESTDQDKANVARYFLNKPGRLSKLDAQSLALLKEHLGEASAEKKQTWVETRVKKFNKNSKELAVITTDLSLTTIEELTARIQSYFTDQAHIVQNCKDIKQSEDEAAASTEEEAKLIARLTETAQTQTMQAQTRQGWEGRRNLIKRYFKRKVMFTTGNVDKDLRLLMPVSCKDDHALVILVKALYALSPSEQTCKYLQVLLQSHFDPQQSIVATFSRHVISRLNRASDAQTLKCRLREADYAPTGALFASLQPFAQGEAAPFDMEHLAVRSALFQRDVSKPRTDGLKLQLNTISKSEVLKSTKPSWIEKVTTPVDYLTPLLDKMLLKKLEDRLRLELGASGVTSQAHMDELWRVRREQLSDRVLERDSHRLNSQKECFREALVQFSQQDDQNYQAWVSQQLNCLRQSLIKGILLELDIQQQKEVQGESWMLCELTENVLAGRQVSGDTYVLTLDSLLLALQQTLKLQIYASPYARQNSKSMLQRSLSNSLIEYATKISSLGPLSVAATKLPSFQAFVAQLPSDINQVKGLLQYKIALMCQILGHAHALTDSLCRFQNTLKFGLEADTNLDHSQKLDLSIPAKGEWQKVNLGSKFKKHHLSLKSEVLFESSMLCTYAAISDEPAINASSKLVRLTKFAKEASLDWQGQGQVYIQYPVDQNYVCQVLNKKYDRVDQHCLSFMDFLDDPCFNPSNLVNYKFDWQDCFSMADLSQNAVYNLPGSFAKQDKQDWRSNVHDQGKRILSLPKGQVVKQVSFAKSGYTKHFLRVPGFEKFTKPILQMLQYVLTESGRIFVICQSEPGTCGELPLLAKGVGLASCLCENLHCFGGFMNDIVIGAQDGKIWHLKDNVGEYNLLTPDKVWAGFEWGDLTVKQVHQIFKNKSKAVYFALVTLSDGVRSVLSADLYQESTALIGRRPTDEQPANQLHPICKYSGDDQPMQISIQDDLVAGVDKVGRVWYHAGIVKAKKEKKEPTGMLLPEQITIENPRENEGFKKKDLEVRQISLGPAYTIVRAKNTKTQEESLKLTGFDFFMDDNERNKDSHFGYKYPTMVNKMLANGLNKSFTVVEARESIYLRPYEVNVLFVCKPKIDGIQGDLKVTISGRSIVSEELKVSEDQDCAEERDKRIERINQRFRALVREQKRDFDEICRKSLPRKGALIALAAKMEPLESALDQDYEARYFQVQQSLFQAVHMMALVAEDPSPSARQAELLADYQAAIRLSGNELLNRMRIQAIANNKAYAGKKESISMNRLFAAAFKEQNRHEKAHETLTLFSQFMFNYANRMNKMDNNDKEPFTTFFWNEASYDCGGPMRDTISEICKELMSDVLPLFRPTANNRSNLEPETDCYQLNERTVEEFNLNKLRFLGHFLGWSLCKIGSLNLDLPKAFWNRLASGPSYTYTIADVRSMDTLLAGSLEQILEQATNFSEADFNAVYEDYTFVLENQMTNETTDLCKDGASKHLTQSNARQYVDLYLKAYTGLDQLQFVALYEGLEDVAQRRIMAVLTPGVAKKRICSDSVISSEAFKASTHCDEGERAGYFWQYIEQCTNLERQKVLKFMSGRTRLQAGVKQYVNFNGDDNDDALPLGHTCSNELELPEYSSFEVLKRNMTIAIEYCDAIDGDDDYMDDMEGEGLRDPWQQDLAAVVDSAAREQQDMPPLPEKNTWPKPEPEEQWQPMYDVTLDPDTGEVIQGVFDTPKKKDQMVDLEMGFNL